MRVAVGVPTYTNFRGLAELFGSLWGNEYTPFVVDNWNENVGVSKGWNKILDATYDYDITVICNDDIYFVNDGFNKLIEGWQNKYTNSMIVSANTDHGLEGTYYPGSPDYACFALNAKQYVDIIGKFDENFSPAYFEDNDSHYRLRLAGFEGDKYAPAHINHKGSVTQNMDKNNPVVSSPMFERNRDYYIKKWGDVPGKEKYTCAHNNPSMGWRDW